ncbi:Putative uncharacterized protein [Taphrina deformans PYCC 5710]|uniref:Pleckstrin homology domain-containing protein n=1 Tax=Taphrina deformans (strain PYCC 5710 / ATCC 11124 / CBS 356.35 / IMI 108563 / JCM 9778 / NBRC 8474) TaxID=1097556 RepID=R4XBL0_TAPDE|nr:Putative uncharacterized protein [Taphrina deformans PYCC 5710]|eukprot:CCG83250.1 Putative uncharacterized protein [Taphrina deformans PYCC 5710]
MPSTPRHHDIDLAAEIGEGLVEEVRKLQSQLFEKDELLKDVTRNRVKQERIAEQLEAKMRTMLVDEEKLKNINWELELTIQQKEESQAALNELASRLESDLVKSNLSCSKQVEEIEGLQEIRLDLETRVKELHTTQATALAKQKEIHNDLRGEIATLMRRLENARADLETQKFASLTRPDMSSPAKKSTREIESEDEMVTPPGSPPLSPIKGTPHRNATLESETLKGTLFHNQTKMLRQRKELEKEKSQRLQLQRQLRELEEELLSVKQLHASQPSKHRRRLGEDAHKSKQRLQTRDVFGIGRRPTSEVSSVEDDFWIEANSDSEYSATDTIRKSHKHSESQTRDSKVSDIDSLHSRFSSETPHDERSFSTMSNYNDNESDSGHSISSRSFTSSKLASNERLSSDKRKSSAILKKPKALDAELEGLSESEATSEVSLKSVLPVSTRDTGVMTEEPWPIYHERSSVAPETTHLAFQTQMTFIQEDPANFDVSISETQDDEVSTLLQETTIAETPELHPSVETHLDMPADLLLEVSQDEPVAGSCTSRPDSGEESPRLKHTVTEVVSSSGGLERDLIEPIVLKFGNTSQTDVSAQNSSLSIATPVATESGSMHASKESIMLDNTTPVAESSPGPFLASVASSESKGPLCIPDNAVQVADEALITISEAKLSELQKNEHDLYATRASLEQLTREKLELLRKLAATTTPLVSEESPQQEDKPTSETAVGIVDTLEIATPFLRPVNTSRAASYASCGPSGNESVLESDFEMPSPERIRQLRTQRYMHSSPTAKAEKVLGKSPSGTNLTSSKSISRSLRSKNSYEQLPKHTEFGMAPPLAPSTAKDTSEDESDDCCGTYSGQPMRSSYVPPARSYSQRSFSSISSFATEIDDRFRTTTTHVADDCASAENPTDPATIESITRTMIGMSMYKYTRRAGRQGLSENRHKRYFWIHPYTKTLYWSVYNPVNAPEGAIIKSAPILTVHVEDDFNTLPPGLHQRSICIETPRRTLKLTAIQTVDHEDWVRALNFLLYGLPARDQSAEDAVETDTIIRDFSPTKSSVSPSRSLARRRGSTSLSGNYDSQRTVRPVSRADRSLSKKISTYFSKSTEPKIENYDLVRGTAWKGSMAMRGSISRREGLTLDNVADGPGLENTTGVSLNQPQSTALVVTGHQLLV